MDAIRFQGLLAANAGKACRVSLKNGMVYEGINVGVCNDVEGRFVLRLENKGGNHSVAHDEVEMIDFNE